MTYHIIYFISILITAALMGYIARYSNKHREITGAPAYMLISFMLCLLMVFEGIMMISPSKEWALFWFNLRFLSFSTLPVLWLIFVFQYSGKNNFITKPVIILIFIIPVVTQIMLWTNNIHGLWVKQTVNFFEVGPFFIINTYARIPAIWYNVHLLYTYACMLLGIIILFTFSVRIFHQSRSQAIALGIGTFVMTIGSLFPALNLIPGMLFNPQPLSFGLGSVIISWSIYKYRFLGTKLLFSKEKRIPVILVILFLVFTFGIVYAGSLYYNIYEKNFKSELENQLSSIAEFKVREIVQWRKERLGNANIFYQNNVFAELVRRFYSDPADIDAEIQIRTWIEKFYTSYQYSNIILIDNMGRSIIAATNKPVNINKFISKHLTEINLSGNITITDFHRDSPDLPIHITVNIPIFGKYSSRPLGFIILIIDPEDYLYPLISSWPTPSKSAETLLVRRDGNDVLYLNELKFRKNTALNFRVPLTNITVPSVMAVLGQRGIVDGVDYRNVPVLAAIYSIPDSPWHMIARMDIEEVYTPLRSRIWNLILLLCLLIASAGTSIGFFWYRQKIRFNNERLDAAESIKESEEKYRTLVDNMQDAVYRCDLNGTLIFTTQSAARLLGCPSVESMIGLNISKDFYNNPDDREKFLNILNEHGKVTHYEVILKRKDNDKRVIVMVNSQFYRDKKNNIIGIEGVISDITERKVSEEALRKSEELFKTVFKDHSAVKLIIDPDTGSIIDANEAAINYYGWPYEKITAMKIQDFNILSPDELKSEIEKAKTRIKTSFEFRHRRADGSVRDVEVYSSNIRLQEKDILHSIIHDITDRKQTEQELKKYKDHLEDLVINRTKELEKAKEEAIAANRAKSIFLSNMSHELRTPLNAIMGFSELMQRESNLTESHIKWLDTIYQSGEHLLALINDILEVSRIESGRIINNQSEINILSLLKETEAMYRIKANVKNLNFISEFSGNLPEYIITDKDKLNLILSNILSNAVKFTNEGFINFKVGVTYENDKHYLIAEIEDTGPGIDKKDIDKIFQKFGKTDTGIKEGGTGLGLAISQHYAKILGGIISVKSELGKGSCFIFKTLITKSKRSG